MTEEQIKQEAEEYASSDKDKIDIIRTVKDWHLRKNGFLAGYLECQKEHEWHYPSKGELPKDDTDMLMSKTLLLITKMKGSDCLSLALGQYNFSTQEFSYQHIVGLTDIYAWKEIVLPELKESE